ncbi:MAG: carboxylesterase/lipase family protein [Clostridia bacterium]|nr:carboxylesterase/lipase family protein [Clostridia bacterium]
MAKNFFCTTSDPVVKTKAGLLRGFFFDGVYRFHGVKYATADRFMPPKAVEPWDGVKDALSYGYVAPLLSPNSPNGDLLIPHRFWVEDEDCLNLNVWTPALDDKKRPVMVWFHGGGYSAGSSIEMVAYEGDEMSKNGDCVVVSVNHRLNILGYFDLSAYGEDFANSVNAGQADLVASLEWVRDNIAAFGGDPDNVTIFGQSGGGGKVISLLQTPSADGLFKRGIMMSGGAGGFREPTLRRDKEIAELLIEELGGSDVSILQTVEFEDLSRAMRAIKGKLDEKGIRPMWAPMANDWYVGDPWNVGYTEHAKTVPLMVGSVIAEWGFAANIPDMDSYAPEKRREMIAGKYGEENADELISLFKEVYPEKNELTLMGISSRKGLLDFADKRAADCSANTYIYLFTYQFPYNGGMPAWHCSDIPFAFHNTCRVAIANEPGVSDGLEQAYFGAYMAFAKNGDPNARGLVKWDAYNDNKTTMYFDAVSSGRQDADYKLQQLLDKVVPSPFAPRKEVKKEEKMTF